MNDIIARLESVTAQMESTVLPIRFHLGASHYEVLGFILDLNALISDLKQEKQNEQNVR